MPDTKTNIYGLTPPVNSEDLYAAMVASYEANWYEPLDEKIHEIIRTEAYDPATLLVYNTTCCPPFCTGKHDRGNVDLSCIVHPGPELLRVSYDGSPNVDAPGWTVHLSAYEYVKNPGRLQYVVGVAGDPNGLHPSGLGWDFDLTPDMLRHLTSLVGAVDELLGGAA